MSLEQTLGHIQGHGSSNWSHLGPTLLRQFLGEAQAQHHGWGLQAAFTNLLCVEAGGLEVQH